MMSLINEALKRAEAEKYRDCGGPPYRPPAVPHAHHVRLPRRWARGLALCCGLVAVTALGMWTMMDKGFWPLTLKAEAADPAPVQAPPELKLQVRQKIDPVLAKTMEETKYYSPTPKPVPARPARVRPAGAAPSAIATTARPAPTPPPAKREEPKPQPKLPDLKLSGVLVSPGGGTAIINGRFLAVGNTIEGARIVKITKYVVTLEMNGRRFTLRQ